jgi:PTS system sucrose-specific IIC component
MDYGKAAQEVADHIGGASNVVGNAACMTRLRIKLADASKVDMDGLKAVDGVLSVVADGDRLEVVFGPGIVNKVLDEFVKLTRIKAGDQEASVNEMAADNKAAQKAKHDKPVQRFLKRIGNIFVPLLPGIIAAGLINGITNVINYSTGSAFATQWWYACITTMGWALFLYLPVLVGINACKEWGGSGVLGAMAGALSISNTAMPLLKKTADGVAAVSLPFAVPTPAFDAATTSISISFTSTYNAAAGGLLGALICGIFFAFLEKKFHKIMPNMLDTFLTPLCTVIVGSIVAVLVLQPAGAFLTQGIFFVLQFVYSSMGVVGGYILSSTFLPLVSVGLHQALTPIHAMLNDPNGPTQGINYLLPILMMAGGGQVGAGLALYLKTKNKKAKKYIKESLPVGILGIGEPLMYAVTLPLGKPFVTACLGAGFGGILAWLFHLGTVSQGVSGLFGLLIVVPGTQIYYVISMLVAYAAGFVLTWFFGVDEDRINDVYGE